MKQSSHKDKQNQSRILDIEDEAVPIDKGSKGTGLKIALFYMPLALLLVGIVGLAAYYSYQRGFLPFGQKPSVVQTPTNPQAVPSDLENQFAKEQTSLSNAIPLPQEIPDSLPLQQAIQKYHSGYSTQAQILLDEIINSSAADKVKAYAHVYAGILAEEAMRYNLAFDHFQRAIALDKENFYAYYNQALTLQKKGLIDEALQSLEKATALRPRRSDILVLKGQLEYDRQDYDKAKSTLQAAEQDPQALYNLALVYKKEGKIAEAKAAFLKVLELVGSGEVATLAAAQLGILSAAQGDYPNAKIYFEKAVRLSPANARYYYNLALVEYYMDDYDAAVANLEKSLSLGAQNPKTFLYVSSLYARLGNLQEAEKALLRGLDVAPLDKELLGQLSDMQIRQNKWNAALITLQKLESLATGILEKSKVLYNTGKVYAEIRDFTKARDFLERAYKLDSSNEDALVELGKIYEQSDNSHKAIELYKEALRINPDNRKVLRELATLYQNLGLSAEAENSYQKLLQHPLRDENDIYYAYNQLGVIYKDRKAFDTALNYFEKSFESKDTDIRYQALAQAANTVLLADKPSALALSYLEKAIALRPDNAAARLLLVKAYLSDGSPRALERAEEESITVTESGASPKLLSKAFTLRGILYYRQGFFERALDMFNRALELDPANQEAFSNKQATAVKL